MIMRAGDSNIDIATAWVFFRVAVGEVLTYLAEYEHRKFLVLRPSGMSGLTCTKRTQAPSLQQRLWSAGSI